MDVVKEDLKSVCVREEFVMQTVSRGGVDSKLRGFFSAFLHILCHHRSRCPPVEESRLVPTCATLTGDTEV